MDRCDVTPINSPSNIDQLAEGEGGDIRRFPRYRRYNVLPCESMIPSALRAPSKLKISVALLTRNGGGLFKEALLAVCAQRLESPFEILAIDSASNDGTENLLRSNPRVTLMVIDPGDFQHGRTRNLAMAHAKGELVAFLTQDAVPVGPEWLASWVAFMDAHPDVAGAFGHQIPHVGADPLEAWEVACHFDSFRHGSPIFRTPPEGAPPQERVRAHFFSNVNSCIRREAWMRIPFREIPFGEDQAWALDVQQAGFATAYCEGAAVRHSHDYGPLTLFRRRYDEARFMRRHLGHSVIATWDQALRTARMHTGYFRAQLEGHYPGERIRPWVRATTRAWASALGNWTGTRLAHREGLAHRIISLTERHRGS